MIIRSASTKIGKNKLINSIGWEKSNIRI